MFIHSVCMDEFFLLKENKNDFEYDDVFQNGFGYIFFFMS